MSLGEHINFLVLLAKLGTSGHLIVWSKDPGQKPVVGSHDFWASCTLVIFLRKSSRA